MNSARATSSEEAATVAVILNDGCKFGRCREKLGDVVDKIKTGY